LVDPLTSGAGPGTPQAQAIARGVARALLAADQAVVTELPLANGRRADLMALGRDGRLAIVEIKSSRADFLADRKWPDYLAYCDRFYFAVGPDFPRSILPADQGLILGDGFFAEIVHEAPCRPLPAARRKAVLLRFARTAAGRLHTLLDPACGGV